MLRLYDFLPAEETIITAVYGEVLKEYKIKPSQVDVDITMLPSQEMRQLNKESRAIDNVTDVLSFPFIEVELPFKKANYAMDINPETGAVYLGEIMICRDVMLEQANEYNHSAERECAYLATHGLHHLLGFDHINDDDKQKMRIGEEKVLDKLNYKRV